MNELTNIDAKATALFEKVSELIEQARKHVATTVNLAEVYTKYHIGQYIVEEEQDGKERAKYGKAILNDLSQRLTKRYGKGWSVENLTLFRKFFIVYSRNQNFVNSVYEIREKGKRCLQNSKSETLLRTSENDNRRLSNATEPRFTLSWSHYLIPQIRK